MVRAPYFDKNGRRKGAWSQEEDDKLRASVQKHGHCNWRELAKFAGLSRCGKSCRLRWLNYLRPEVRQGNYSKEEEELIIDLHEQLGNRWSMIAAKLPGRSDNAVKNFWHTHLKGRVKHSQKSSSNTSRREIIQERENRSPKVLSCTPSNPILESNPLSPETSCSEFSCSSPDSAAAVGMSGTVMIADNGLGSYAAAEESVADFWTEPFVADDTYNQDGCSSYMLEEGFMSPYDNVDLFYQMMQEFL